MRNDQLQMLNSGHCWDHTNNRPDAQLRGEEHPGLQRGGGHQPGGGGAERDGVGCFLLFFPWIQSSFFFPVRASPEWIPSERSLRSQGWSKTSNLQVNLDSIAVLVNPPLYMELICKRNQHTAVNMSNELINFTQMSWSGTKLTRSSETEGSGSTEREHSSTRQIFLLFDLKSRVRQNILLPGKSFFHTK